MALRGKKPEKKDKRLKIFVYGKAGIGKTIATIQFPNAYIIDTEKGTDFYSDTIKKNNSNVFQSVNPDEIKEEIIELLVNKHNFKTLIIDPITQVYNSTQEKWNRIFEKNSKVTKDKDIQDFGMRYWGKVKGNFKAIQRLIIALDMNVIITAHEKIVYGENFSKLGVTFDSMKGDDYLFDYIFRLEKRGQERIAITEKERAEIGKNKFPPEFVWSYENFLKFYGKDIIEKEVEPLKMATKEQIIKIKSLIKIVNVDDVTINKWFNKANASTWEELTEEQLQKCIDYLNKEIKTVTNGG